MSGTTTAPRWRPRTACWRFGWAGRGDVTATNVLWRFHKSVPQLPSPLVYENVLYMVNDGGVVTTLQP